MSLIDDLVRDLCPNGVEYAPLGQLLEYQQPGKYLVASTAYDDGFATPVLTAGQSFVLGYTDEVAGIYSASPESPVMIFDDFTTAFKWVDFPFKAKSSAMKMLTSKEADPAALRFAFYAMQTIRYAPHDHARQWISTYSHFRIAHPPLEVQRKIVSVLDALQALEAKVEAELTAELEMRRHQCIHFRRELMTFPDREGMRWTTIGEALSNLDSQRRPVTRSDRRIGDYPYYGANGVQDYVDDYIFDGTFLLIGEDGSVVQADGSPVVNWATGKIWVNNHAHVLAAKSDDVNLRFVFQYLQTVDIRSYVTGGMQMKLNQGSLNRIAIPVLPAGDQKRIASLLDKLDTLTNELSAGLRSEAKARRQQFEYFRNKLVTFDEATA